MTAVYLLRYLGKTLSSFSNDWPAVERNLQRARGNGNVRGISWEGRKQIEELWGGFMWQWCKRCFYLGPRSGL